MLSDLERSRRRVRITLALAVFYWTDVFLLSLPAAAANTPELLVPAMLVVGLPLLAYTIKVVLSYARTQSNTLAYVDDLTGLGNRRSFRAHTTELLQRARPGSVALVVIDVIGLKRINDTCGHQAGDELLTYVAAHLTRAAHDADNVYRFGGDEFAIVIDRNSGSSAAEVVANLNGFGVIFRSCGHEHEVALSYGFVSNLGGEEIDALFQRADQRLREFKHRPRPGYNETEAPDYTRDPRTAYAAAEAMNISILEERRMARRAH